MEKVSTVDSVFLDVEHEGGPALAVGIALQISGKPPTLAQLRGFVRSRLSGVERFRQRAVPSRSPSLTGKWVTVDPDLNYHVTQRKIRSGDTIDATVSKIMMLPFDRTRPLWDCTLLTGYAPDQWTCVWRLHHSIADQSSPLVMLGRTIDLSPEGGVTLSDALAASAFSSTDDVEQTVAPGGLGGVMAKSVKAVEEGLDSLGQFIATSPDTVLTLREVMPKRSTELTSSVSDERVWVGGRYPLSHVKIARKAFAGVSVTDMVLASVAVGFRRLFESRGEDPTGRTVRAVIPMPAGSVAQESGEADGGLLPAMLPVGETDVLRRLKIVRASTKHGQRSMAPLIGDRLRKATERAAPRLLLSFMEMEQTAPQYFSETLVASTPGPTTTLYFMGKKLIGSVPMVPISEAMRIVVGVTTYCDALDIGVTGDGLYAPDVDVLLRGMIEGLDELVQVAAAQRARR